MSFIVYILYSKTIDQFYIGHTENLNDRVFRHNNSGSKATKKANDWAIVYQENLKQEQKPIIEKWSLKRKKAENT